MNFDTFKPGQLACVKTLDVPVAVSAGAGSGKTFTLTQRIAWALMEGSASDGERFLRGIDEVLAITFTEKAAGEIKARVKSVLRAEGMAEEALKVDGAWISTIHGMCSRILRSHAIELGIDPSFQVLGEARAHELLDEAIEEVLSGTNEFSTPHDMDALFGEYHARPLDAFDRNAIESMVRTLVARIVASPKGSGCFALPPSSRSASAILRELVEHMETLRDAAAAQKPGERRDIWLSRADTFIENAWKTLGLGTVDACALVPLFEQCPVPNAGFGAKAYKELAKAGQGICEALALEVKFLIARPLLDDLLELSSEVAEGYRRRKDALCVLDNDDLLIRTARALEESDALAQEFADKFKLIMVDEFQDTDQLQVDMIERMAGPGTARLCTVGDAQQSIYRFRGADVSVYKRRLSAVRAANPDGMIELPDNFRSHADVLSFVDCIFGQPQVFGSEFMSLSASRREPVRMPFKGDRRIDVLLTTHPRSGGVNSAAVRCIEAVRIARRLSELRAAGHAAGEMAVLLGRMSNAGVYAQALRDEGFACVIAGGSVFSAAPEVRVMLRLAQVIANPRETASLFELLASDMFALSADDFLELSTRMDGTRGVFARRSLDEGFAELEKEAQGGAQFSPQLLHAVAIVRDLSRKANCMPASRIMAEAVRDTGWLSRLDAQGAEGLSVAGNVLKAVRLVERFEAEGASGPAEAARLLAAHMEAVKEAPGALSAAGGDFVSIMTVHASKGLEFPIVAVAEMEKGGGADSAKLSCEMVDGVAYPMLLPDASVSGKGGLWGMGKVKDEYSALPAFHEGAAPADIADAPNALVRASAMKAYASEQELQERRRLLYVALTRAKEALIFAMNTTQRSSGFTSGADFGVYDDVRSALFGAGDFEAGDTCVDFGGTTRALVSRIDATEETIAEYLGEDSEGEGKGGEAANFDIPAIPAEEVRNDAPWRPLRRDVTSYSALAAAEEGIADATGGPSASDSPYGVAEDEDGAFWDALCASLTVDADRATDVGTAFHLLAQRMAYEKILAVPNDAVVERVMHQCGLGASCKERLVAALSRWRASDVAANVAHRMHVQPELPFFVAIPLPNGEDGQKSVYLEGAIDLFAYDTPGSGIATIVDYKTGGHADETPDALHAKHLLQASCYAYATLAQGFDAVEEVFVRVEQSDEANPAQPQCVRYRFEQKDMARLEGRILGAYARIAQSK